MNRFYNLARLDYSDYATASYEGTFKKNPPCPNCKNQGFQRWERISPLVIEWQPDSDLIGDFTWPSGLGELVVTDRVKQCLELQSVTGVDFGPVKMIQNPKLKKPTRMSSRTKKRIWLPYEGPPLWDMLTCSWCNLDMIASKRTITYECSICHRQEYSYTPDTPLVVNPDTWDGSEVFRIREMGRLVFVLGRVKSIIEKNSFSNVTVEERGNIAHKSGGGKEGNGDALL